MEKQAFKQKSINSQKCVLFLNNNRVDFWSNKCRSNNVKSLALLLKIKSHFILNDNLESVYSRKQHFLVHAHFLSTCLQHCYEFTQRDQNCVVIITFQNEDILLLGFGIYKNSSIRFHLRQTASKLRFKLQINKNQNKKLN